MGDVFTDRFWKMAVRYLSNTFQEVSRPVSSPP
jgi:hypothetical protein